MDLERFHQHRLPFEEMEAAVVRRIVARPGELHPARQNALRYVLSFAKLQVVQNRDGQDVDVSEALAAHAWHTRQELGPWLTGEEGGLVRAAQHLPHLVEETRDRRRRLLEHFPLDAASLDAEVCERPLVVSCGGGGGAGYGYAGAWQSLHRADLQPALISGTSMGALIALFRARRRVFDPAPMYHAAQRLTWGGVFRILEQESRYGVPATLRLYLRAAIGSLFHSPDGRPLTFRDLEVPLLVVATGLGVDALKHDLSYYEHFLDDAVSPEFRLRPSRAQKLAQVANIFRELLATPDALREVVFGGDEATEDADILDAAGFSSSIPGLIHYDIVRDDARMKSLLDGLYARYGITRLVEGGLVNNLPVRPAYDAVLRGRIRRRNAWYLALDCFRPRARSVMFYAVQQLVRPNVQRNVAYANHYFALQRTLNPLNLVPDYDDVLRASDWTSSELEPHMPMIVESCRTLSPL
jgi:predicted acylesterase/phospholipase RssA